jgi:hypothetical protein
MEMLAAHQHTGDEEQSNRTEPQQAMCAAETALHRRYLTVASVNGHCHSTIS